MASCRFRAVSPFSSVILSVSFLLLLPHPSQPLNPFSIYKSAQAIAITLAQIWARLAPLLGDNPYPPFTSKYINPLATEIADLKQKIAALDISVASKSAQALGYLNHQLPNTLRQELQIASLVDTIQEINRKDLLFKTYVSTAGNDSWALWHLTESIISHDAGSVLNLWDRLHTVFLAPENLIPGGLQPPSILKILVDDFNKGYNENLCNIQESPSQLLFNIYNSLQMTQLKAYALMQFSWMYRQLKNGTSHYDVEPEIYRKKYLQHLENQTRVAKEVMSLASKELKRCDPKEHIPEITYTTLSGFLQGFVVNEADLNSEKDCDQDCSYYQYTKQYGCFENQYCSKQRWCQGSVVNCKFVDSSMHVCHAYGSRSGSSRRYDWIKYENGRVFGGDQGSTCNQTISAVESWSRWLIWQCSYCMCICDDRDNLSSERYFSLKPSLANTKYNRILVGLRLIKKNQVIHIQGQEAVLLPDGHIKESSLSWIPTEIINAHSPDYKESVDYHKMSWEQRAIDLDDLVAPKGYLLTGVKWRKLGSHLNLEIKVCEFNYTKGELVEGGNKCHWISNDNTGHPRRRLDLPTPGLPTKINYPSDVFSKNNTFIEFTHSDFNQDAGQEVVPFIDTQDVVTVPPVPLTGAGIYHKRFLNSGGFIAPKIFTLNYTDYIESPNNE